MTPAVARLYEAINAERVAVAAAVGASVPTLADWFERVYGVRGATLVETCQQLTYNSAGPYQATGTPKSLDHKFITEDVPDRLDPDERTRRGGRDDTGKPRDGFFFSHIIPLHKRSGRHEACRLVLALEGATSYGASAVADPPGHRSRRGASSTGNGTVALADRPAWLAYHNPTRRPPEVQGNGRLSVKLLEQRICLFQIACIEAFSEPAIDGSEQVAGFVAAALVAQ